LRRGIENERPAHDLLYRVRAHVMTSDELTAA